MAMGNIVEDWLHSLKLRMYAESFIENGYDDLEICKQIGPADLDAIGVFNYAHRSCILDAVRLMREEGAASVYFTLEEVLRKGQKCDCGVHPCGCSPRQDCKSSVEEPVREGSPQRQKIDKHELNDTIRQILYQDCIDLSVPPYSKSDGNAGTIEGLASQYADQLRTFYADVLEIVEAIREEEWSRKMENLKARRRSKNSKESAKKHAAKKADVGASLSSVESVASDKARGRPSDDSDGARSSTSSAASSSQVESRENSAERTTETGEEAPSDGFYNPGKYMPSSCLSDAEGEEIYGYRYSLLVSPGCRPSGRPFASTTDVCCPAVGLPAYGHELLGAPCFCNCGEQTCSSTAVAVEERRQVIEPCVCAHCVSNARAQHPAVAGNRLASKKQRHSTLSRFFRTLRVAKKTNPSSSSRKGESGAVGSSSGGPGLDGMAADPLITPMPPTLPTSSASATSSSSGYGGGAPHAPTDRRVPSASCRDDYQPSDVSSSSASSVSHGHLSESRETVLSGSKSDAKAEGDQKNDTKAAASMEASKHKSDRGHKTREPRGRPNGNNQDAESRRYYRQTKYLQSGCLSDVEAEEIYGYRCGFVPPSSLRLTSGEPAAYSSMGDLCYQVGLRGCETDLRGACISPACYFGCPMGCGDHAAVDRCAPLGDAQPGRLIPGPGGHVGVHGTASARRMNAGGGAGGGSAAANCNSVSGHFVPHVSGHPSLPPYYANVAAAAAAAGVATNKKRNSALSRIFPTLRASRKGASGGKRNAKAGKTGNEAEASVHRKCPDDNLAADPLIQPVLSEWNEVPRLPLRNLNQALDVDDRHSDPGTQDAHQYAVPMVGPPSHLVSCSACSLEPSSEFYPPGRISISEAVHRYKEIERRKKEKNSPVTGASPVRTMMTPTHGVSPVVHERADSDSTNFSSMNAPSSPPSESGSSTHPLIPPSSGRSSFSEDRMSMFGADRRKKDSSGGPSGKGGVWSYRKTALNDAMSPPPSPAPLSPPLCLSSAGGAQGLGGIGGVGGGPSGGGVVPIAYARAVCSSYEAGPPAGTIPSGRILDFKKGDSIEVLWSNGNGAWIGRCNGKMGWFPASSVMLISPAVGVGNGNGGLSSAGGGQGGGGGLTDPLGRGQPPASISSSVRPRPTRPTWGSSTGKQPVS